MNNMSTGMKSIMVPIKEPILAKQLRRGASIEDAPQESLKIIEDQTPNVANVIEKSTLDTGRAHSLDAEILPTGHKPIVDDYHEIVSEQRKVQRGDSGGSFGKAEKTTTKQESKLLLMSDQKPLPQIEI